MFSVIIQTHSRTTQPHLPTNAYKKKQNKKNCSTHQKIIWFIDSHSYWSMYCCQSV